MFSNASHGRAVQIFHPHVVFGMLPRPSSNLTRPARPLKIVVFHTCGIILGSARRSRRSDCIGLPGSPPHSTRPSSEAHAAVGATVFIIEDVHLKAWYFRVPGLGYLDVRYRSPCRRRRRPRGFMGHRRRCGFIRACHHPWSVYGCNIARWDAGCYVNAFSSIFLETRQRIFFASIRLFHHKHRYVSLQPARSKQNCCQMRVHIHYFISIQCTPFQAKPAAGQSSVLLIST
jgi:hypothetical protein